MSRAQPQTNLKPARSGLPELLASAGLSIKDAADFCRASRSTMSLFINHGKAVKSGDRQHQMAADLVALLASKGVPSAVARKALPRMKKPTKNQKAQALPQTSAVLPEPFEIPTNETSTTPTTTEEEFPMLLQKQALTQAAKRHFGLPRDPFMDDVQSRDDVFQTDSVRYVRAVLMDCALHHGFVAITGESGAGKSTLADDLEQRIHDEQRNVLVIRPYVLQMELSDTKGKTLKSGEIARAIIRTLDETATCRSSPDALMRQLHTMLQASARSGRQHLLLIEEAHCLPTATLKHLKRFTELKDGLRRLLGVALIGQPELRTRLLNAGPEVREVTQRCELVELAPLDADVGAYLMHKFARFNLDLGRVLEPGALDAIRARLIHIPRGGRATDAQSICYPLVVNNLVTKAMNAAAQAGYPVVDASVIEGV